MTEFETRPTADPWGSSAPTVEDEPRASFASTEAPGETSGVATAMAEARTAAERGLVDGFVERMAERVGGRASVHAVFGDPIEREGLTIIPVARVRWGFGGGAGTAPIPMGPGRAGEASAFTDRGDASEPTTGSGSGGGGGVIADPIGYLEIDAAGARFRPIASPMPSPGFLLAAGTTAALVLGGLARLIRR